MDQLPVGQLVELGYLMLVAPCPKCNLLVKVGVEACPNCRAALPRTRPDEEILIGVPGDDSPPYERPTPFIECPNCRKLLALGTQLCPECREEIDPGYAVSNAAAFVLTTKAVSAADVVEGTRLIAFFVALVSVTAFFLDVYSFGRPFLFILTLVPSAAFALRALGWMRRYGWLPLQNEDFLSARRKVKPTLFVWLGLLAAQVLVLLLRLSGVL